MTSFSIYKSTFRFTLMRILTGLLSVLLIVGLPVIAFLVTGSAEDETRIIVCIIALIAACIIVGLLSHFVGYIFRAGQIAVAANAIKEDKLPENAYEEGKAAVKKRFGTVAVFFAIEKVINAIVSQLTSGVTKLTDKLGKNNDTVQTIGTVVSIVINAMLKFMCACCMGWVFIHPDTNAWRSALDGAILYFKNWKDLLKNTGKVIGFGLLSLILIGGLMFGASHLVMHNNSALVEMTEALETHLKEMDTQELAATLSTEEESTEKTAETVSFLQNLTAAQWRLIFEGVVALILWGIIHSALVDPYIMISVMNRYIPAGLANPPARENDSKLAELSKSYKKALAEAAE